MSTAAQPAPTAPTPADMIPHSRAEFVRRFGQGEFGSLRVIIILAVIWAIFQAAESRFLTSVNLVNLSLQIAAVGTISVGVVLVLLLGEIDLSVGIVSGMCAAVMAVLNVKHGWGGPLAVLAGVVVGTAIGTFQGTVFTRFGIPSFVVTLAGLLGWQGVMLWVLGSTGTVNISDSFIVNLAGTFFDDITGWIIGLIAVGVFAFAQLNGRRRRVATGLEAPPVGALGLRIGAVGLAMAATIAVVNADRGLPLALVILVGFVLLFQWITTRTRFGRYIYAVGGNIEAARRAGIPVDKVRIAVFALSSCMAACGGVLAASRLLAVNQSSGGSDLLLLAIAGPVIAGTSLFGGRGTVWSALLGALVIGSISNGMDLLALPSEDKFMVTGAVLLLAVIIDAVTGSKRRQAGRV
jgi:D-xylose transport system permease protein